MKLYFDDSDFDGQLQRTATAAYSGSADLGEMLVAAARVTPGDGGTWYDAWSATAAAAETQAGESLASGDGASAAGAWLRASEYWRQAFFFVRDEIDDPRLQTGWIRHRDAFRAALRGLPCSTVTAEIAFGGGTMTGYLMRPPGPIRARPTVMLPAGYDSTAESGYAATGFMALRHDMNAFVYEGPGQGGTLYRDHIPMRPDYEAVLPPLVDWLLGQDGVDPAGLVLVGRSFAGYLAPRGAAHEPRLAALVCDPGQYDFLGRLAGFLPKFVPAAVGEHVLEKVLAGDRAIDALLDEALKIPAARMFLKPRMTTMGAKAVGDFIRMQALYTLDGHAGLIRCPTLVVDCEGDFASQGDKLYAALTCPKTMLRLSAASGAGGHCGGLGQLVWERPVFDWIEATLGAKR